jgi:hypothetical protein
MASPHVAAVAAMMLEKNPGLTQARIEVLLKGNTLAFPPSGTRAVFDFDHWTTVGGIPCAETWHVMRSARAAGRSGTRCEAGSAIGPKLGAAWDAGDLAVGWPPAPGT